MSDVLDKDAGTDGSADDGKTKSEIEQLKAENEKLKKDLENVTSAQAGSDAKVNKLLKELETAEAEKQAAIEAEKQAGLSEVEKLNERLAAVEKREKEANAKAAQSEFLSKAKGLLNEKGLTSKHMADREILTYLDDLEGLESRLGEIAEVIKADADKEASNRLGKNAYKPKSGGADDAGEWDWNAHTEEENLAQYAKEMQGTNILPADADVLPT